MRAAPNREGMEHKIENRQHMRQPDFQICQISKNTTIICKNNENNSAGFAGAIILATVDVLLSYFWKSEKYANLAGACFAYSLFSAPHKENIPSKVGQGCGGSLMLPGLFSS
jgi:hypothetical protein